MNPSGKIEVLFLHPRDCKEYRAAIGNATTGQKALDELVKAGFLDAPNGESLYALQHQGTGKSLPLSAAIVASGVQNGDRVAITMTGISAGG